MNSENVCACPDCQCEVGEGHLHLVSRDGKDFCSEACASGHENGAGCCGNSCDCQG